MLSTPVRRSIHQEIKRYETRFMPDKARTGPIKMFVDVTSRCNLDCHMCWREFTFANAFGDMSLETFKNILPLMDNLDRVTLQASGEPFMNRNFIEMLRLTAQRNNGIVFATNGTIMSEKYAEELVHNRVQQVLVSLDAATRQTYEKIRIGSKWEHVLKNIQIMIDTRTRLNSARPDITMEFVLMRSNVEELPEFVRLAHRFGIKFVGIRHVWVFGESTKNETMFLYPELMQEKFTETEQLGNELGIYVDLPPQSGIKFAEDYMIRSFNDPRFDPFIQNIYEKPAPGKICYEPWNNFLVTWDGNVYPCCQTNRIMGNINDAGFQEVWNGLAYRLFRNGIRTGHYPKECIGCRNLRDPE